MQPDGQDVVPTGSQLVQHLQRLFWRTIALAAGDNAARHSEIVEGLSERARQGLNARLDLKPAPREALGGDGHFHMHDVFVVHAPQILSGHIAVIVDRP